MAITFVNPGTAGYGTGAVSAGIPSGYAAGDILILIITGKSATPALPGGWTNISTGDAGNPPFQRVCYKIAGSSESAVSIADSGTYTYAVIVAYTGVDTANPINASAVLYNYGNNYAPTITTTVDNCMVVYCASLYTGLNANNTNNASGIYGTTLLLTEAFDDYMKQNSTNAGGVMIYHGAKSVAGICKQEPNTPTYTGVTSTFYVNTTAVALTPYVAAPLGTGFLQFFM